LNTKVAHPELFQNQHYLDLLSKVEALRPMVPAYDPRSDNVEQMKYESARLEMFKLMMRIIKP
jgi:hypothetical protein